MNAEPPSVDYLLDLADAARSHPDHDSSATAAHDLSQIAIQAERTADAMRRGDWRVASNLHFGLAGALDDAIEFLGVVLDPTKSIDSRVDIVDALDKADARQQWADLPPPASISADTDRVAVTLVDGSSVEAWFPDAHDPVYSIVRWIWDQYGPDAVYDALAHALVRPGDSSTSHSRTDTAT